jgi:hypothetical protein
MKFLLYLTLFAVYITSVFSQPQMRWLDEQSREQNFPSNTFYTGFASGSIRAGETKEKTMERLRKEAQAYCLESIRVNVTSTVNDYSKSIKEMVSNSETQEKIEAIFESTVKTEATAEITGLKVETYADTNGLFYAFAYVNKYELITYYNSLLNLNLQHLESAIQAANSLEVLGEKTKAKKQYEEAVSLLVKIGQTQDILIAIEPNAPPQHNKMSNYRSEIIQALARLQQGIYIFVEDSEDVFGKQKTFIINTIKTKLSHNGCSFTDNNAESDLTLKINASARKYGEPAQIVFCYADVEIELIKTKTGKTIYQEEFQQKGGHTSYENAAREAFIEAGKYFANKLLQWVKDEN